MKLWKISQDENDNYDTYDSAIVAAETVEEARDIYPGGEENKAVNWDRMDRYFPWARTRESVKVEYIGEAAPTIRAGVVLASFNAG